MFRRSVSIVTVALLVCSSGRAHSSPDTAPSCDWKSSASEGAALDAADGEAQLSLLQAAAGPHRTTSGKAPRVQPASQNQSRQEVTTPEASLVATIASEVVVPLAPAEQKTKETNSSGEPFMLSAEDAFNSRPVLEMVQEMLRDDPSSPFMVQTLIFISIFVVVVALIYCVSAAADGALAPEGQQAARASLMSSLPCFTSRAATRPPAQRLLSGREMFPAMSQRQSLVAHSSKSLAPAKGMAYAEPSSSALQGRTGATSGDNWHLELPTISPALVIPAAHTRLAVPLAPLFAPLFEVDVLGLSGVPLLSAALVDQSGSRCIQISLHNSSNVLAVVTSAKEVFGADGTAFGTLVKEDKGADELTHTLRDRTSRPILAVTSTRRDNRDFKMTSIVGGRKVERATAVRRPAGKLPAEHYEVVANPNVDAVLVLACFLGVLVFEPTLPSSGRPSERMQPDTSSAVGRYWGYKD